VYVGRDSSVGITTPVQSGSETPVQRLPVSFQEVKRLERGVTYVEVEEWVELYLYSSSEPSVHVLGRILPFLFNSVLNKYLKRSFILSVVSTVLRQTM
jgi:hypothetical protein